MRFKFLLFTLFLWGAIANAQEIEYVYEDTMNHLVITEAYIHWPHTSYLELTNMGDEELRLDQFKLNYHGGGETLDYTTGKMEGTDAGHNLPSVVLQPKESYVMAAIREWEPTQFAKGLRGYNEKRVQDNMWELADFYVYMDENNGEDGDTVTPGHSNTFGNLWWGQNGLFITQFFADGDSMVIDQVNILFEGEDGQSQNRINREPAERILSKNPACGLEPSPMRAVYSISSSM